MNKKLIFFFMLAGCSFVALAQQCLYKDKCQPVQVRVDDLLGRMTLDEKIMQLNQYTLGENDNPNNIGNEVSELPPEIGSLIYLCADPELRNTIQKKAVEQSRLGIPILFGFDVIHGYRTVYPISLAQACSFNPNLVQQACSMAAREAVLTGIDWTFSPMIDVARDARWGRISEGYGEDPFLNATMGVASVHGYQGDDLSQPYSIASCLKHFVGYGKSEGGRDYRYTDISNQSLWETYLPPFEACIKAGAATVMSAFNDISGVPASANHYTLTEILKQRWNHKGFVVSDWNSIEQLIYQGVAKDSKEAALKAFSAGVEMDMRDNCYGKYLAELVAEGKISLAKIDDAVARILRLKFQLGLFDDPYVTVKRESERYLRKQDKALAASLAEETMVLLKNNNEVLPLRQDVQSIALIGPLAQDKDNLLGAWAFKGQAKDVESIYEGMQKEFGKRVQINYALGCTLEGQDLSGFEAALQAAKQSDVVVLCLGESRYWSGENASRSTIALPAIQEQLALYLTKANKPIVLVLSSGRPLELQRLEPLADAIIAMWQPGVAGGSPLAGIVSGRVNPSGKLAVTFPLSTGQIPIYYNMRRSARPFDRMGDYQDIQTKPLYEFGYGLSYTQFVYSDAKLSDSTITPDGLLKASVKVTNTGKYAGKETVLWYLSDPVSAVSRPVKELKHYEKHLLQPGESRVFTFEINPKQDLSYVNANGERILEEGEFVIMIGDQKLRFNLEKNTQSDRFVTVSVDSLALGPQRPLYVYNNWSAYDELSDNIPLNETLSMKELEQVKRLKEAGVKIDYYMMDAFWFDLNAGYRGWRKDCWPNGPQPWIKACKEVGVKPGLWFSTNLLRIGGNNTLSVIPAWESSLSADSTTLCLFHGGYLSHLMETLQQYVDMGFEMFKFDFAYFDAAPAEIKQILSREEIIKRNTQAFRSAIRSFRQKNPTVMFIGYNGFGGDMENTTAPFRKSVDLQWLDIFDTMYCGDPRISDVPMMNFWRSQDLYSDHMTAQYLYNGLPQHRIDNCAFMIGTTGTCYNRGLSAWKGMMLLSLARGGWLNVCHGNIDLLSQDDVAWMARAQRLYDEAQQGDCFTFGGIPGHGVAYGYCSTTSTGKLFTVVNASQSKTSICLPTAQGIGTVLFTDSGCSPQLQGDIVELGPEQMAVVGYGNYSDLNFDLGFEKDVLIPCSIQEIAIKPVVKDAHTLFATLGLQPSDADYIRIVFQQLDGNGVPFRSWGGAPPYGKKMDEFFQIKVTQNGKTLPISKSYDKMIWCGLSWAVAELKLPRQTNLNNPIEISCHTIDGQASQCQLKLYKVSY